MSSDDRGNGVLNCGHAVVRRLILDSLRLWAQDFRIDGFAFLNAEALTHGETRCTILAWLWRDSL